ncbi:hypothetical protein MA16_Dca011608 [Dendrobium catenatum]|uniref:Uncharacterized protein n=1 Tax=Dendrobium catenatum TaxID=906689 RepID=A0A2I0WQQ4_9ASPA|nr:hypothetical protein MA16_Dca011608 [Dendrobium catenatum]
MLLEIDKSEGKENDNADDEGEAVSHKWGHLRHFFPSKPREAGGSSGPREVAKGRGK